MSQFFYVVKNILVTVILFEVVHLIRTAPGPRSRGCASFLVWETPQSPTSRSIPGERDARVHINILFYRLEVVEDEDFQISFQK